MPDIPMDWEVESEIEYMRGLLSPLDVPIDLPASLSGSAMLSKLRALEATNTVGDTGPDEPHPFAAEEISPAKDVSKVIRFTPALRRVTAVAAVLLVALCVARFGRPGVRVHSGDPAPEAAKSATGGTHKNLGAGAPAAAPAPASPKSESAAGTSVRTPASYLELFGAMGIPTITERSAHQSSTAPLMADSANVASFSMNKGGLQAASAGGGSLFQTDGSYLYTLVNTSQGQAVSIIEAKSLALTSTIPIEKERTVSQILVAENDLVLIDNTGLALEGTPLAASQLDTRADVGGLETSSVRATFYDITNRKSPVANGFLEQTGTYVTAQLVENTLCLVSSQPLGPKQSESPLAADLLPIAWQSGEDPTYLSAKDIYVDQAASLNSYAVVSALSLEKGVGYTSAVLGDCDTLYIDGEDLYLSTTETEQFRLRRFSWVDTLACQSETVLAGQLLPNGLTAYEDTLQLAVEDPESAGDNYLVLDRKTLALRSAQENVASDAAEVFFTEAHAYLPEQGNSSALLSLDLADPSVSQRFSLGGEAIRFYTPSADSLVVLGHVDKQPTLWQISGGILRSIALPEEVTAGTRLLADPSGQYLALSTQSGYLFYHVGENSLREMGHFPSNVGEGISLDDQLYLFGGDSVTRFNWQTGEMGPSVSL